MSRALLFSLLFPLLALAQDSSSGSELPPAGYNGGSDNPQDSDDAGAAGSSKGAFELSSGGLVAIIVVAVIVVIGGSTFLNSVYLGIIMLTSLQLAQQHSGGSQRSANGTSGRPSVVLLDASPGVQQSTSANKTVKTAVLASVSTRRRPARTQSASKSTILRRPCRCRRRKARRLQPSRARSGRHATPFVLHKLLSVVPGACLRQQYPARPCGRRAKLRPLVDVKGRQLPLLMRCIASV
jgi:hypothetical protein